MLEALGSLLLTGLLCYLLVWTFPCFPIRPVNGYDSYELYTQVLQGPPLWDLIYKLYLLLFSFSRVFLVCELIFNLQTLSSRLWLLKFLYPHIGIIFAIAPTRIFDAVCIFFRVILKLENVWLIILLSFLHDCSHWEAESSGLNLQILRRQIYLPSCVIFSYIS